MDLTKLALPACFSRTAPTKMKGILQRISLEGNIIISLVEFLFQSLPSIAASSFDLNRRKAPAS